MRCLKLKILFKQAWRSLSTAFRRSWRYTTCKILQRYRRRRRFDDCCSCRFFFFVCCLDCLVLINLFDFDDFASDENACLDIRFSRNNNVRNECNVSFKWWFNSWSQTKKQKQRQWSSWSRGIRWKWNDWRTCLKIYWSRNWFFFRDWIRQTQCCVSEHNAFDIAHISRRNRNKSAELKCHHWWAFRWSLFVCSAASFWIVKRNRWRFDWWLKWWFITWWTNHLIFLICTNWTIFWKFVTL